MKKIIYIASAVCLMFAATSKQAYAQPVSDRAVIPVAVTLNQILRLNVTDGGNIEFVFNTIDNYKNGISNTAFYDTDFNVASSTNWSLDMGSEGATFFGTDDPTNTMALNAVCYQIAVAGTYTLANNYAEPTSAISGFVDLATSATVITEGGVNGFNGGDITDNAFTINWEAGTTNCGINTGATDNMLSDNITPDRYVTNVTMDINLRP